MKRTFKVMMGERQICEIDSIPTDSADNINLEEYVPSIKVKNTTIDHAIMKSEGADTVEAYLEGKVFDVLYKNRLTGEIVDRIDGVRIINDKD